MAKEEPERRPVGRPRLTEEQRRARRSPVARAARPPIAPRHPLHVTLYVKPGLPSLREPARYARVLGALAAGADRFGMRLVVFSVQDDALHLVVEARDRVALTRGMQGMVIRVAKAANRGERSGKVFKDRYDAVALTTAERVRAALVWVLGAHRRSAPRAPAIDPCSSGPWFDGWRGDVRALVRAARAARALPDEAPVVAPRTALLARGWRALGLIALSELTPRAR